MVNQLCPCKENATTVSNNVLQLVLHVTCAWSENQKEYFHAKLNTVRLSTVLIYENDSKSKYYTGLAWGTFLTLFTFLTQFTPLVG